MENRGVISRLSSKAAGTLTKLSQAFDSLDGRSAQASFIAVTKDYEMLDYDMVVVILGLILEVVIIFGLPVLVAMLVAAVFIKIFAGTLSFGRACLIALRSFAVATVLLTIYYIVKIIFLLPWTFDVPAIILWLALAGRSTTRRLTKYGIEKTERFGVGAKTAASLFALICVAVGVNRFLLK